jgi:hypothetical protein
MLGADSLAKNDNGYTALHYAIMGDEEDTVRVQTATVAQYFNLKLWICTWSILLLCSFCNDFEPHLSFQLCSS